MITTIIAALGTDRSIGRNGDLAFHISSDLRRFKALTTGHTVVMGRKTFESLPKGALPNRRNIVITRNAEATFPGAEIAPSLEYALKMATDAGETEAFVIGGGQIYAAAMPVADRLALTEVLAEAPDADTFFPAFSREVWEETENSGTLTDEKSGLAYRFVCFSRK